MVLVNYRCLALITRQLESGALDGAKVVIVDNDSDPKGVEDLARRFGAEVQLAERNLGFAGAVNCAVASIAAQGIEAYLLLNPDVEIRAEQIEELYQALGDGQYAAVGPIIVDDSGRPWVSTAGGPVTVASVLWYFVGLSHLMPRLSGFFWTRRQVRSGTALQPRWLCGASLLISASAWERYGPLPEDEIVYGEDVGWGIRCTSAGGTLGLVRTVIVRHSGGASGESDRWVGATARMFVRTLGPIRGKVASGVMQVGLRGRRAVRRVLRTSQ